MSATLSISWKKKYKIKKEIIKIGAINTGFKKLLKKKNYIKFLELTAPILEKSQYKCKSKQITNYKEYKTLTLVLPNEIRF